MAWQRGAQARHRMRPAGLPVRNNAACEHLLAGLSHPQLKGLAWRDRNGCSTYQPQPAGSIEALPHASAAACYEEVWYVEEGEDGGNGAARESSAEKFSAGPGAAWLGPKRTHGAGTVQVGSARAEKRVRPEARLPRKRAAADLELRPGRDDAGAAVLAWALGEHFRPSWWRGEEHVNT